jgi:hypothetical protein
MSTSARSMLSFLRFRARRGSRAERTPGLARSHLANPELPGPGLGALVRVPAHPAPTVTMPTSAPPAADVSQPAMLASQPLAPCALPQPTMLARTLPDASLLTPAATIPTVLVPIMRTQTRATPRQQAPVEGAETTTLPSRKDAPPTTIHPRRAR